MWLHPRHTIGRVFVSIAVLVSVATVFGVSRTYLIDGDSSVVDTVTNNTPVENQAMSDNEHSHGQTDEYHRALACAWSNIRHYESKACDPASMPTPELNQEDGRGPSVSALAST